MSEILTRRLRAALVARDMLLISALTLAADAASAQPLILPGARLPDAGLSSDHYGAPALSGQTSVGSVVPARPATVRSGDEESVLNKDLKLNGVSGRIRLERSGRSDLKARITLEGTRISQPEEACAISIGDDQPVALVGRGRPEGLPRYELQAPVCPVALDVLNGSVWVKAPAEVCVVTAADCRVDAKGLWGPEPQVLAAQAPTLEAERGQADRAVRESYKVLAQKARPQEVRAIVSEQAAFSSERDMFCSAYAREAAHGFCHARFTVARAAQLAVRLGGVAAAAPATVRRRETNQGTALQVEAE